MYNEWLELKDKIKDLTTKLHDIEASIWIQAEKAGNLNLKGGKSFTDGEFKITITHADSVKIDQKYAATRPDLFKVKYEFDKTGYIFLVSEQKKIVDDAMTLTPSKPNFKIVRV